MKTKEIALIVSVTVLVVAVIIFFAARGMTGAAIGKPVNTCVDSDGGKNYEKAGYITITGYGKGTTRWRDNCASDTAVVEAYCKYSWLAGRYYPDYDVHECENGCMNATCY